MSEYDFLIFLVSFVGGWFLGLLAVVFWQERIFAFLDKLLGPILDKFGL